MTHHQQAGRGKLTEAQKCWRCRGEGYYFRVPNGHNPFLMGAVVAANSSTRVNCFECQGTGRRTLSEAQT